MLNPTIYPILSRYEYFCAEEFKDFLANMRDAEKEDARDEADDLVASVVLALTPFLEAGGDLARIVVKAWGESYDSLPEDVKAKLIKAVEEARHD
jgi:hypothetical protein